MNIAGRTWFRVLLFAVIAVLVVGIVWRASPQNEVPRDNLLRTKSIEGKGSKKVILLLADSLMYQALDKGLEQDELPTFKRLIQSGTYYKDIVSSFPTMSVTIDSSLLTGTYPHQHRVPGLIWYSSKENRVINYGTGPMEEIKQGLDPMFTDLLMNLNKRHLNPNTKTIHETLASHGFTSGSINGLIYRGNTTHTMTIPALLDMPTTLPKQFEVNGPTFFSFGALANPLEGVENLPDSILSKYGFTNEYALQTAKYLIESDQLPDFLFAYLPELDKKMHRKGPVDLEDVKKLDSQLNTFLQTFGSVENALQKVVLIILGDSGMSQLRPTGQQPVIELEKLPGQYAVFRTGGTVDENTQIVLAVNETMAYVYLTDPTITLKQIAEQLNRESRIDLVAWKEGDWINVTRNGISGIFRYKKDGKIRDIYGQTWSSNNNWDVVDASLDENNLLTFDQYPDVLQRLYAALHSHEGRFLVVTAKEGYELADRYSPTHRGGGGHGSLHKTESLVPIIVCGAAADLKYHRIVDIKDFLLKLIIK